MLRQVVDLEPGLEGGPPFGTLLRPDHHFDDDGRTKRTGTAWSAAAHVITAVIGSGVLSLAWSIAQLGWVAGPPVMLAFALVTYYTSILLADCYRTPNDPVNGKRNYTYMEAVRSTLGPHYIWVGGIVQYVNLAATSIGYTITAALSMMALQKLDCRHRNGESCTASSTPYMIIFGVLQLVLSQIPDFDRITVLSYLAAAMSFTYSFIGLGLTMAKTIAHGRVHGTAFGVDIGPTLSPLNRTWQVFQALGNVAFAYSFSLILIEIQDTLKSPPPENKSMKKATLIAVLTTTVFYMSVGCFGYAAFGKDAPGNLLTGFFEPYWLVMLAHISIVIHLLGAYQVYSQPVFAVVEGWAASNFTKSSFIHQNYYCGFVRINLFRLVWRSLFVVVTTIISMLLPFFNDIMGLLGALAFWPLTVYFPVKMYERQTGVEKWSQKWIGLHSISIVCLLVTIAGTIGSIAGIITSLKTYRLFKST